jgi:hypothetical protein
MKSKNPSELSNDELMQEEKKQKSRIRVLQIIISLMLGIQLYNTIKNGFSISTLTPLCFIPLLISIQNSYKDVQKEMQSRKNQIV